MSQKDRCPVGSDPANDPIVTRIESFMMGLQLLVLHPFIHLSSQELRKLFGGEFLT